MRPGPIVQADLGAGLIGDLWRRHPDIAVRFLRRASGEEVNDAVARGEADAGVCDLPAAEDLVAVPFERREVVVLAPPGAGLPDPVPVARLGELPFVLPAAGSVRRAAFDRMFAALDIAPRVAFESDERSSWIPAVVAGVGCCIWYRSQGELARTMGAEVIGLDPPLERTIAVVHRPSPGAAVDALLAVAADRAAAAAPARNI